MGVECPCTTPDHCTTCGLWVASRTVDFPFLLVTKGEVGSDCRGGRKTRPDQGYVETSRESKRGLLWRVRGRSERKWHPSEESNHPLVITVLNDVFEVTRQKKKKNYIRRKGYPHPTSATRRHTDSTCKNKRLCSLLLRKEGVTG